MTSSTLGGSIAAAPPFAPAREALVTERLVLRPPSSEDAAMRADFARRNREHLALWEPARAASYFEEAHWARVLATLDLDITAGRAAAWGLHLRDDASRLVGTVKFDQIHLGAFRSCMLGYALDGGLEGRGLMTEALRAAIAHVFAGWRLHRIQANHVPENVRSAAVLRRLGFVREGLAPKYLFINGAWRDHVLNALIHPSFDDAWMNA